MKKVKSIAANEKSAGPIAQLVELPAHNRLVPGSSPGGPTTKRTAELIFYMVGKC